MCKSTQVVVWFPFQYGRGEKGLGTKLHTTAQVAEQVAQRIDDWYVYVAVLLNPDPRLWMRGSHARLAYRGVLRPD